MLDGPNSSAFTSPRPLADAEPPALPMTREVRKRQNPEPPGSEDVEGRRWDFKPKRPRAPRGGLFFPGGLFGRNRVVDPADGDARSGPSARADRTFAFDRAVTLESLRQDQAAFAAARDWDQFHTPRNVLLAMVGEVGELSELFQWRGDAGCGVDLPSWSDADKTHLGEEMADVLLYLVRLADRCGVDLPAVAKAKLAKNEAKYPAEKCFGSAAKYTAYA